MNNLSTEVPPTDHPADRLALLSSAHRLRAERVRARAAELDDCLAPLRIAAQRRASELELSAAALEVIAGGLYEEAA